MPGNSGELLHHPLHIQVISANAYITQELERPAAIIDLMRKPNRCLSMILGNVVQYATHIQLSYGVDGINKKR